MLSQTAEYALRAVICLGINANDALSTQQIARKAKIPAGYLAKVLQTLRRAGLVRSTRGTKGGFVLAHELDGLNLLDIIHAVDPILPLQASYRGGSIEARALSKMQRQINAILADLERQLQDCRIGSMIEKCDDGKRP